VPVVTRGYCREEGIVVGTNYVRLDLIHDMWCEKCGPKKEWLDREVVAGRKSKIKCTECRKKWVAARREKVEEGEYGKCRKTKRKKVLQPNNSGCNLSLKAWGWIESKREGNAQ